MFARMSSRSYLTVPGTRRQRKWAKPRPGFEYRAVRAAEGDAEVLEGVLLEHGNAAGEPSELNRALAVISPHGSCRAERGRRAHFRNAPAHITLCSPRRRQLAWPLERFALLRGYSRVEPYEPRGVCLVEFGNGFS